jgi:5-deoxy-glucuronate isomerase
MIRKHKNDYKVGYNAIASVDDQSDIACMDFGIIKLDRDDIYVNNEAKERAILLIFGKVTLAFEGKEEMVSRGSFLDENPVCLHLPKDVEVTITAQASSELAYEAVYNDTAFDTKIYTQEECITDQFGKGVMGETSLRHVRTVIDDDVAPYSNLVIGEVINFPGKWSSYPAHHHIHPEIYHYRFYPDQGFGFSCEGEKVFKVRDKDTAVIKGGMVHPQTSAPGYAMYYIWLIPHTPTRWRKDREFISDDDWLLKENPVIWPDKE